MWMEAKAILTVFGIIFIAIVLSQIILVNMLLGFLLFMSIGLFVFSDFLIGYQITRNHVNVLIDPLPSGYELCVYLDFSGNIDFLKVKKGPLGKREFVKYKKEASIINSGDAQLRFINGNHGFLGHENYSKNVNIEKAEALDKLPGDNIKEAVKIIPMVPVKEMHGV